MTLIWTIGHSTRSLAEFVDLLKENNVQAVADVRQYPGSRRYPHFGRDALSEALGVEGIEYLHLPALGGRRRPRPDSKNTALRNDAFRGYADYMETSEYEEGIRSLLALAESLRTAVMCSEAVWWRCHRSLIADYLKSSGYDVVHILAPHSSERHPYTSAARIVDGRLSYRDEGKGEDAS